MILRFTIAELLLLTLVAAIGCGLWAAGDGEFFGPALVMMVAGFLIAFRR